MKVVPVAFCLFTCQLKLPVKVYTGDLHCINGKFQSFRVETMLQNLEYNSSKHRKWACA